MSEMDRESTIAFDPNSGGLRLQSNEKTRWSGCRCTAGIRLVKRENSKPIGYSFECAVLDQEGTVREGWSEADASLKLGTDKVGWGYGGTGVKVHDNKYDEYPSVGNRASFSKGDVIGCHLKLEQDGCATLSFSKNGEMQGEAFKVGPEDSKKVLYPTICMKNASVALNFSKSLTFPLPDGFTSVSSAIDGGEAVENPNHVLSSVKSPSGERKGPIAIVIEPTRDLAEQSYEAFVNLGKRLRETTVGAALLVGGIKPTETLKKLKGNDVDVLVGTPPIIASYLKKGIIVSSRCRIFVLDEADELISADSVDTVLEIYGRLVAATAAHQTLFDRLQVCFFSATLQSRQVRDLAEKLCHQPVWVDLRGHNDSILPETVHHCFVQVTPAELQPHQEPIETDAVHRNGNLSHRVEMSMINGTAANHSELIKQWKPRIIVDVMERFGMDQVLVFCRTNLDCDLLEKYLKNVGGGGGIGIADKFSCRVLAGMRSMEERQKSLRAFKEGDVRILIATDVAARGIDILNLPFVINCTLPDKPETYVHRVGRVGRAERIGLAVSLVATVKERVWFCRKGKKPPCQDTRDFDAGGNCIWYDEPQFAGKIEQLLSANSVQVTKLQYPSLILPESIQVLLQGKAYGERVDTSGPLDPEMKAKLDEIKAQLDILADVESSMQKDYWKSRHRFQKVKSQH